MQPAHELHASSSQSLSHGQVNCPIRGACKTNLTQKEKSWQLLAEKPQTKTPTPNDARKVRRRTVAKKTTPRARERPPYSSGHRAGTRRSPAAPRGWSVESDGSARGGTGETARPAGRDRRQGHGWWQVGQGSAAGCRVSLDVAGMAPGYPLRGVATLTAYARKLQKTPTKQGESVVQVGERGGCCASFRRDF